MADSASLTATGAISDAPRYLHGITIITHTAAATVTLYDHPTAARGTAVAIFRQGVGESKYKQLPQSTEAGSYFNKGVWCVISGTGVTVVYPK